MSYWPDLEDILGELKEYDSSKISKKEPEQSNEEPKKVYHSVVNDVLKAIRANRKFVGARALNYQTTWYTNFVYGSNSGPRWSREREYYNELLNLVTSIPNDLEFDELKESMIRARGYFVHVEMFNCEMSFRSGDLELLRPLTPGTKNKVLIAVDNNGLPHAFRNMSGCEVDLFELQELLKECTKDNLEYIMAVKDIDTYIEYCRSRSKK